VAPWVEKERVRRVPGVGALWFHGVAPSFACARHCGEAVVVSGRTPVDALGQLEEDRRARNRDTIRDAFRLL
jgi:hypothetical protein